MDLPDIENQFVFYGAFTLFVIYLAYIFIQPLFSKKSRPKDGEL